MCRIARFFAVLVAGRRYQLLGCEDVLERLAEDLVGSEMVDPTYVTPLLANHCAREMLTGVAMRHHGITDPHYLHLHPTDHGQG